MTASNPVSPNVQKAVDQFQIEADKTIQSILDKLKARTPPPVIYHYKGDAGLKGILETGQLWLTDVFSLNDPSELNHGFSLMLKVLMSNAVSPHAKNFAQGLVESASASELDRVEITSSVHSASLGTISASGGRMQTTGEDMYSVLMQASSRPLSPKRDNRVTRRLHR